VRGGLRVAGRGLSVVSCQLSVVSPRLATLDASASEPRPRASASLDFGMTKLQVVYVIIGLVVALTMILAMLPIGR
jgi:hypothetical protein